MVVRASIRLIARGVVVIVLAGCAQHVVPPASVATTVSPSPSAEVDSEPPSEEPSPNADVLVADGSAPGPIGFWDARAGLVAGRDPQGRPAIARTSDGGRTMTWVELDTDVPSEISVFGSSDAVYLSGCTEEPAVDCAPSLERTSDRGRTWTTVGSGAQLAGLRRISFAGGVGWGVANASPADNDPNPNAAVLRRTLDGGKTWKTVRDTCPAAWPTLEDVSFIDARNGWLVCDAPGAGTMAPTAIYVTTDGARSFVVRSTSDFGGPRNLGRPPSGPVGAIEAADLTTAFVMQSRSGTARTDDSGVTWTNTLPGEPEIVFVDTMSATNDGQVFALASDGNVRQIILEASADGGRTWEARAAWPMD
jgi:photosystem II stability/assembly factor-like uncharacterized protein